MTTDEQIITLDIDRDETVENLKAVLEVETQVALQQQQLYNGKEMRNGEKLSVLGLSDGDLVLMVSGSSTPSPSANDLSFNQDGSAVNPAAFQQHIRNDSNLMSQLFQTDPQLAQAILGNVLNKLQQLLREHNRHKSEMRRQQDEELALLYVDPFNVELRRKSKLQFAREPLTCNMWYMLAAVISRLLGNKVVYEDIDQSIFSTLNSSSKRGAFSASSVDLSDENLFDRLLLVLHGLLSSFQPSWLKMNTNSRSTTESMRGFTVFDQEVA